jgi:glycosyltransferase involved in cell wall biosynthesis
MNVLAILGPEINGCVYHRIIGPMGHLAENHKELNVTFGTDLADFAYADLINYSAIIVSRSITSVPSLFDTVADRLEKVLNDRPETKLIVDTDDAWHLPDYDQRSGYWKEYGIAEMIERSLALATEVWTTTKALQELVKKINPNCVIIPNAINSNLAAWRVAAGKLNSSKYRIGIFCQSTHEKNIARLKAGIRRTIDTHSDVQIVCFGVSKGRQPQVMRILGLTHKDPVTFLERLPLDEYADLYRQIDILLAPLYHDEFNAMRSNLKLHECATSKTPIVAERWGPYDINVKGLKNVVDWSNLHTYVKKHRDIIPLKELKPTYEQNQENRYNRLTK